MMKFLFRIVSIVLFVGLSAPSLSASDVQQTSDWSVIERAKSIVRRLPQKANKRLVHAATQFKQAYQRFITCLQGEGECSQLRKDLYRTAVAVIVYFAIVGAIALKLKADERRQKAFDEESEQQPVQPQSKPQWTPSPQRVSPLTRYELLQQERSLSQQPTQSQSKSQWTPSLQQVSPPPIYAPYHARHQEQSLSQQPTQSPQQQVSPPPKYKAVYH